MSVCLAAIGILAPPATASTVVSGTLSTDTTWDVAGSPYIVSPSLHVTGATLTIRPGVEVRFVAGAWLVVGQNGAATGTLIARGTEADPVVFTSHPPSPAKGDWGSLTFGPSAAHGVADAGTGEWLSGSVLEHCVIEYGGGDYYDAQGPAVVGFGRYDAYGAIELIQSSPVIRAITCRWSEQRGLSADMTGTPVPVIIRNSLFEENGSDPERGYGGGMELAGVRNSLVEGCTFRRNRIDTNLRFGAGIGVLNSTSLVIRDCLFEENDAERFRNGIGGGINLYSSSTITIEECDFIGNAASIGGAIGDYYSNRVTVSGCLFQGNSTVSDNVAGSGNDWTVEDCEFFENQAEGAGGGLALRGSGGVARYNTFRDNTAGWAAGAMVWYDTQFEHNPVEDNTALYMGGGLWISDSGGWPGPSGLVCANNVIRGNHAGWGGGGILITLDNSTLIGNEITFNTTDGAGGGLYIDEPYDEPSMTVVLAGDAITHNTFAGNEAPRGAAICSELASTALAVDATGVCWGTMDTGLIEDRIWHGVNDPTLGLVDFGAMVDCTITTDVSEVSSPGSVTMAAGHPNPFRSHATLVFTLESTATARVDVFDPVGRRVVRLAERRFDAGQHRLRWDGRDGRGREVPAGSYLIRLDTGSEVRTQKVLAVR